MTLKRLTTKPNIPKHYPERDFVSHIVKIALGAACELLPKLSKSFLFQYSFLTKTNLEINFTTKLAPGLMFSSDLDFKLSLAEFFSLKTKERSCYIITRNCIENIR